MLQNGQGGPEKDDSFSFVFSGMKEVGQLIWHHLSYCIFTHQCDIICLICFFLGQKTALENSSSSTRQEPQFLKELDVENG